MKKIFLIIASLFISIPAFATNYYIDYNGTQGTSGNDSNNGTTTSTPWKTCTNLEGNNFLKPGDIVNIAAGDDFIGTDAHCTIASSGSPISHITVQRYGTGADPIFDGSVLPSDATLGVSGWSGWTIFSNNYSFTVTSANATAGATYTNNGQTFTVVTTITGSTNLVATPTGAPASSGTLILASGTGDATITFSAAVQANIYVSNVTVPWDVEGIIEDGTSSIARLRTGQQTIANMQTLKSRFYQATTFPTLIYIRMLDDSDPNTHVLRFNRFDPYNFRGIVRTDDTYGSYIDFSHLQVNGSLWMGFSSSGSYVTFTNCTGFANSRESFYIIKHAVSNATGATYNILQSDTASWSNTWGNQGLAGASGQQYTIESPHVDLIDVISHDSFQAGIDWLDYASDTNASDGRCIRCISYNNGRRAAFKDPFGFDAAGLYVDGGNNIQLINCVMYIDDVNLNSLSVANAYAVVQVGTEHPTTKPVANIDIIGSLFYSNNYKLLNLGAALNCSGSACNVFNNIRVVGNTLSGSNGSNSMSMIDFASTGLQGFIYNNVINNGSTSAIVATAGTVTSDYNVLNTSNANDLFNGNQTLAAWQTATGQDTHSVNASPIFTGSGSIGGINQSFFLSSIAAGQGSDSPALGLAFPNYLSTQYVFSSIGTVRTDAVIDSTTTPASGYHYLQQFQSSTFPSTQVGTDYN